MFNRKERLQISKKLKTKGRPSNKVVNWRNVRNEKKKQREEHVLKELEEKQCRRLNATFAEKDTDHEQVPVASDSKIGNQKSWYSLTVALPGSILNNIQTRELRAYVVGQLARSFAIFCVDEVVVFDEMARMSQAEVDAYYAWDGGAWTGERPIKENNSECNFHMARILEYLECPQYLRRSIFPIHNSLQFAGLLNPLDATHHLRSTDLELPYREGMVLERPAKSGQRCDVGLDRDLVLENSDWIPPFTRITVKLDSNTYDCKQLNGTLTSARAVREEAGVYWGYSVRIAKSLSEVLSNSYDFVVGTSEKGTPLSGLVIPAREKCKLLIVFGGLAGLEAALEADQSIGETDPAGYFPNYVNCLPDQGSRVIRTEEAIPICLAALKYKLDTASPSI